MAAPTITTENNVTFAEFSLTHTTREQLKAALDPFVRGERTPAAGELGKIIEPILGENIIKELRHMMIPDPLSQKVYIIHNMPEVEKEAFVEIMGEHADVYPYFSSYNHTGLYNHSIVKGLEEIFALERVNSAHLMRKANHPNTILGHQHHNHAGEQDITTISGIVSDGAPTCFTNLLSAAKGGLSTNAYADRDLWQSPPHQIIFSSTDLNSSDKEVIRQNSRNTVVKEGDLMMWAEDGVLLHAAMPAKEHNAVHAPDEITRAISVYGLKRATSIG